MQKWHRARLPGRPERGRNREPRRAERRPRLKREDPDSSQIAVSRTDSECDTTSQAFANQDAYMQYCKAEREMLDCRRFH